jgi:tRNA (mo5U34)-methyltransferase
MSLFSALFLAIKNTELEPVFKNLKEKIDYNYSSKNHGDVEKWLALLNRIPDITPSEITLDCGQIMIGEKSDFDDSQRNSLAKLLLEFQPWRKGPFNLLGIHLDTEWRSDWKWDRLKNEISPLSSKTVLTTVYACLVLVQSR